MTLPLHGFADWQTSLRTADLQSLQSGVIVNSIDSANSPELDMRAYSSYSIAISATTTGVPTGIGNVEISIGWYVDPVIGGIIWEEYYEIFPRNVAGGVFLNTNGGLLVQDSVHGPYLFVIIQNLGPDQISLDITVLGNSRTLSRRYVAPYENSGSAMFNTDASMPNVASAAIGAGLTVNFMWPIAPGLKTLFVQTLTSPMLYQFFTPSGRFIGFIRTIVGAEFIQQIAFPRTAVRVQITNTGAIGGIATIGGATTAETW
jgi:hypothetical protein